jgi:hypothetical protein
MAFLTDRSLATGVTLDDLIHIVITGDTSQGNPAGSSYKAKVSQVGNAFSSLFVNQSGDTMTGPLIVPTISATTYQNLPQDIYVTGMTFNNSNYDLTIYRNDGVSFSDDLSILASEITITGGTYNPITGVVVFTNNTGGTFDVSGFTTGYTDIKVTAYTYSSNTFTIYETDGSTHDATINTMTGLTINGNLNVTGNTNTGPTTASTLNISSTPTTDTGLTANYLTRDGSTGEVKVKTIPGPTVYGLFAQTGNSVTATATTQTSLIDGGVGSLSVPANGFSVGDSFRADFGGLISVKPGGDTIRIRVTSNAGAITLADTGNLSVDQINPADVWNLVLNFTVRQIGGAGTASIVTLGNLHVVKTSSGTPYSYGFNVVNQSTFNTTISNQLDVTVAWGSTNAANTMYSDIFVLNKIY